MSNCDFAQQLETDAPVICGNCDWTGKASETEDISDVQERLAPGEIVPVGQCPECGALAHLDYSGAPKRWYVTMTWDSWPEGGSFGAVVDAPNSEMAEAMCREEMAETRSDPADNDAEYYLREYGHTWHVVDCFDLDEFIERNGRRPAPAEPAQ